MKKSGSLILAIGIVMIVGQPAAANELLEIRDKRLDLKQDVLEKESHIEALGKDEQIYLAELKSLDDEVAEVNQKVRNLNNALNASEKTIVEMKKEIDNLSDRISLREQLIKERLRTMQSQDGLGMYVDLIFDSKSLSQLFDTATVIGTIIKADKELLAKHQADQQTLKDQEQELHRKKISLENDHQEMQSLKDELQQKTDEKQELLDSIQKEKQNSESELMDMYEIYVNLASQEIAILKENQRVEYHSVESGDVFIMPAEGELTSGYGPRWGRLHAGIDIADESPDAVVVAAASGTVIRSYYSATYGNCVLITHKINGKTFTSLYAHLEKSTVTTGQSISKGEVLGYMGNTGDSRGKHLHFEIHEGKWNYGKSNSVNPLQYVKK
ncbi:murein hydrolase activator EnvC family protein [Mesobacillus jeotgali]|uniref:murein hydrolase activator EnvC family protein n=1 Tax=Mesobacillus jeotgali TaxID=129985 RepID=UPI001F2B08C4|nr:peptidoglycan DD-metalloendopeptidase family protein [Mesobacillus jeotgali]